jgi:AmmeMemoRadiSam system protein A
VEVKLQGFGNRINKLERFIIFSAVFVYLLSYSALMGNGNNVQDINTFKPVDERDGKILLRIAREAIQSYVSTRKIPGFSPEVDVLKEKRGVFVTLYKNGNLRGCIGTHVGTEPLYKLLPYIAVQSAFYDRRFLPVTKEELKDIKVEISVYLSEVVKINDISEYKLGEHGIIMRKGLYASTFLPEVPEEQGWDKTTTLEQLCLKAGLSKDAWKDSDCEFYIYSVQVIKE